MDFGFLYVYVKGGLYLWDKDINGGKIDDGIDVMYGIGVEYFIIGLFLVGVSYMNYIMDSIDVGMFLFNVMFYFL